MKKKELKIEKIFIYIKNYLSLILRCLKQLSIDYEQIYLVGDLLSLETIARNIACHQTYLNVSQHIFNIREQRYPWLRLYYLNSTFECQLTILESLADNWLSKQLFKWTFGLNKFICLAHRIINSIKKRNGEPKDIKNLKLGTLGYPKFREKHGYGASHSTCHINLWYVFGNSNRKGRAADFYWLFIRYYSVECQPFNIIKKINNIIELSKKFPNNKLNITLYSLFYDKEIYYLAYNNLIKSNSRDMLKDLDYTLLNGISDAWLIDIIQSMRDESFIFKPARSILILKKDGNCRQLSIAGLRDKIIQEVIRLILEAVFEPIFSNNSHGFRKKRSCHSALYQVEKDFQVSRWIIKCDIMNFFDNVQYNLVINQLRTRISDNRLLNLIYKYFNTGYNFNSRFISNNLVGIPKWDILSPLLFNIILYKLDLFILKLKNNVDKGIISKIDINYQQLKVKKSYFSIEENSSRLSYVRYLDDFIIGLCVPYTEVLNLSKKLEDFILKDLGIVAKINIINFSTDTVNFLGTLIILGKTFQKKINQFNNDCIIKTIDQRKEKKILFFAPIVDIKNKLIYHNFINSNNVIVPKFTWLSKDIKEIINLYNNVIESILNYYSFVFNFSDLMRLLWNIMSISCAKLLASKLKLGTVRQVFLNFGNPIKYNGLALLKPKT